jgi:sigma-E factor negative regulatory protein RseB
MKQAVLVSLVSASLGWHAAYAGPEDASDWLQKAATAARKLNYQGTFVYQHGSQVNTSRVIHIADEAGDRAKLVAVDGPLREIIRDNDEIRCYLPSSKIIKVERRSSRGSFPALLPEQLSQLADHYKIEKGGVDRAAGYECQVVILKPRDTFRYGRFFCAENQTGLLLKSKTFNDKNEVIEQITFPEVQIGVAIDPQWLKPSYSSQSESWRIDRSAVSESVVSGTGWAVQNPPPGFKKILEMKRNVEGKSSPVAHLVYSDGLAAVSVFAEPLPSSSTSAVNGVSQQGAVHIYVRTVGEEHRATVLGETPAVTVLQIGNSLVNPAGRQAQQ